MLKNNFYYYSGFSLLEISIGLCVGAFMLTALTLLYSQVIRSSNSLLLSARLNYELRSVIELMSTDIRRAGYSANAASSLGNPGIINPFMASSVDIVTPSSQCILFAYDINKTGILPALNSAPNDARFGFRLQNNVIQTRAPADNQFNCIAGQWINVTNNQLIKVTNLNFSITPSVITLNNNISTLTSRNITITLTGQLIKNANVKQTLIQNVWVRNERFQP